MRRAAAVVVAALAVAVPATASADVVAPQHGVNVGLVNANTSSAEIQANAADAAALGANSLRVALIWGDMEPNKGQLDAGTMAKVDEFMDAASSRGLKVIPTIYGTPCWASSAPDNLRQGCANPARDVYRYPPADPNDYAAFAARFVSRYAGKLAALEVWNEPDQSGMEYWTGPDLAGNYAALLKATYPAVKAVDPSLPVLGGSLVGANGRFLQALYDAGIKGSYDGLAVHYYDLVLSALGSIRTVQQRNGDSTPLWLTEFGWSGCEQADRKHRVGGHTCVSDNLQAGNLLDVFRGLRPLKYVQASIVYELRDGLGGSANFGLETTAGKRKQSFGAVTKAFRGGQGTSRKPTLKLKANRATGTAPAGDVITVSLFRAGAKKATSSVTVNPDRNQNYSVKLPRAVAKGGWVVQALQPFTGRRVEKST